MKGRLRFLLYFIFFLSSNTTIEHSTSSAGDLRQHFLNSNFTTGPKALARTAPRREPETILLDESEEAEGAAENGEEGRPIPVQIGHRPVDAKLVLKRQLGNAYDGNDFDFDYGNTTNTKLPTPNK